LRATPKNVRAAAEVVRAGGLVVYPTDTVYGLGCDPFNVTAVRRLIRIKGARDKPLPILSSSLDEAERVAELSEQARRIARRFWPGPLTLVLPNKSLPNEVTFGLPTVGVRIPDHRIALGLIRWSGGVLVGTSANKASVSPPTTAAEAYECLGNEVDVVLDGGQAKIGASSTVLDLTAKTPKVLRRGPASPDEVLGFLKEST
jgi:L-threonylcarbamoyladenylate synthase